MGPCQGGFCNYRAGGVLSESVEVSAEQANRAMADFVQRRWKGQRPLLWGQSLRQALLDEHIYRTVLGLDLLESAITNWELGIEAQRDGR
jgi:glycerol-3-phosphate dehydrogenase